MIIPPPPMMRVSFDQGEFIIISAGVDDLRARFQIFFFLLFFSLKFFFLARHASCVKDLCIGNCYGMVLLAGLVNIYGAVLYIDLPPSLSFPPFQRLCLILEILCFPSRVT